MKIFDGVEMEFFDINEELPENQEQVIMVIKEGASSRYPRFQEEITVCKAHIYKKTPPRFAEIGEYGYKDYRKADIKCWGRLKKK